MVEVIIPAYNRPDMLARALNSLANQTIKEFYVFVSDDGSTEDLRPVVQHYAQSMRVFYTRNPNNSGPGIARQLGINHAFQLPEVHYLMFLDSDDILMPNAIEELTLAITQGNFDIVASPIKIIDKTGRRINSPVEKNTQWTHGKIYKKDFLYKTGLRFSSLRYNEDSCFNLQAHYLTRAIGQLPEPVYLFMQNEGSTCANAAETQEKTNFSNKQYIMGQCEAFTNILKAHKGSPIQAVAGMAITIINIYKFYEILKDANAPELEEVAPKIREALHSDPRIPYLINGNPELIGQFLSMLQQGEMNSMGFTFFSENIKKFCDKFGIGDFIENTFKAAPLPEGMVWPMPAPPVPGMPPVVEEIKEE